MSWDLRAEPDLVDTRRGRLLAALADIEDDSRFMQKKLRDMGALREISLIDFNNQWLCEENEHATALRALARKRGVEADPIEHGYGARDPRAIWAVLAYRIGSLNSEAITASYLAHGAVQEYIALSAYVLLAESAPTQNERDILRGIARQEGRHMKFYRTGALSIMSNGRKSTRSFVRWVFEKYWIPPGIELLGRSNWLRLFSPLLITDEARERLAGADRILQLFPGLEDIHVMGDFLSNNPSDSMYALAGAPA